MKEFIWQHDAVIGGEFSGHIVLRDRGMDYDDGIYVGARLLEALATYPASPAEVFATLPEGINTLKSKPLGLMPLLPPCPSGWPISSYRPNA
ncbi:MAG: hypothetical protein R3E89_18205 [Thiolinea sp.]